MKVYEFGDKSKPIILLLPGTCFTWDGNYSRVIEGLQKSFFVACISYDGFDETEQTEFRSMLEETKKIEDYVKKHYNGRVHTAYGCSLGGSFVGLLVSRRNIIIEHGIIGSSDMDSAGKLAGKLKTKLAMPIIYRFIHNGGFKNKFMKRFMDKRMEQRGEYGREMMRMMGIGSRDLKFITKKSMENQFYSDMITELPEKIDVPGTTIHVFYALKMGEKYRERYYKYFKNPDIIEMDLEHEELLIMYPEEWIAKVEEVSAPLLT